MKKSATLYRMVTPDHLCPWGLKAKDQLERAGYEVDDNQLKTMEENDAFKEEHGYGETPQIFIEGERLGGYDEMRSFLGKPPEPKQGKSYQPVVAVFATTFLMALSATYAMTGGLPVIRFLELFIAFSMCVLAVLKLRDLSSFSNMFLSYDMLARRVVRYAYVYPFVEVGAGILMIAGLLTWVAAPAALFIGMIGGISVFKAVYIDKRDLKCACMGGGSDVPLGFISLTENIMMVLMAIWMMVKAGLGL
ncbi:MAG: glutaredoxin [Verrucomicrobiales bacterium]|nr:glutaredoxin [Verrucomicrobiales bacterium]